MIHPDNRHLLLVGDADYSEEFRGVLRRLHQAMSDEDVRQKMVVEDEIVTEFEERDRREQRLAELAGEGRRLKEEEALPGESEARAREANAWARGEETGRREQEERWLREEERLQKEAALTELAELKRRLER